MKCFFWNKQKNKQTNKIQSSSESNILTTFALFLNRFFNKCLHVTNKKVSNITKLRYQLRKKNSEMMKTYNVKLQTQYLTKLCNFLDLLQCTSANLSTNTCTSHIYNPKCATSSKNSIYKIEVEVKEDLISLVTNYCHSSSPHKSWQFLKSL